MKYFIIAKFLKHLELWICKYWYILRCGNQPNENWWKSRTHQVGPLYKTKL